MSKSRGSASSLIVRVGPMCGGKTLWLHQNILTLSGVGYTCVVVNNTEDKRTSAHEILSTNSAIKITIKGEFIKPFKVKNLKEIIDPIKDLIKDKTRIALFIDEAQFYPDLIEAICLIKQIPGMIIHVVGLDAFVNSENNIVPTSVCNLCSYSDSFKKINAICDDCCLHEPTETMKDIPRASHSFRLGGDTLISVGGKEKYLSLCGYHFNERKKGGDKKEEHI